MYMIYGRTKGKGSFRPLDLNEGVFVFNLLFASMIFDEEKAKRIVSRLTEGNPGYEFEYRKKR